MNKLKHSSVSPKKLLDKIVNNLVNKKKKLYNSVENRVKSYYDEYDNNTTNLEVVNIHYNDTNGQEATFLKNLYSRDKVDIASLWTDVMNQNGNQVIRCPLCGIDRVCHFDHYMPRSKFPEFSVHSNNLIPLCAICNDKKSQVWLNDKNERIIFNAYYDEPKDNVLTCTISISANNLPWVKVDYLQPKTSWTIHERTIKQLDIIPRIASELNDMLSDKIEDIKSDFDSNIQTKEEYFTDYKEKCQKMIENKKVSEKERLLCEGIISSSSFENWILNQM